MPDPTIVCTLSSETLTARRAELASLVRQARRSEVLPSGTRLLFTASTETLTALARVVDAERQCCRFLRFAITVEADGGPIGLEVSGPAGAREFIGSLLEA